jgi:hypothetical protein
MQETGMDAKFFEIDTKMEALRAKTGSFPSKILRDYQERLDVSWIFHDNALEGVVLSYSELKAAIDPVQVDEEKSATIDVRDLVDLPASDDVQLRDGKFTTQRAAATCTASGKDDAVYSAGREAPWIDSCLVPLRIDGQSTWSYVVVPVAIRPKNPQAATTRTTPGVTLEGPSVYGPSFTDSTISAVAAAAYRPSRLAGRRRRPPATIGRTSRAGEHHTELARVMPAMIVIDR